MERGHKMPIKLITGQPGNGKTLYAVSLINEALKRGREVYTNINGISLDVLPIPENDKGELDWTMTPKGDENIGVKGALIVYDETQKLPYFAYKSKEKLSSNPLITELETHRHYGYDLIFITQSPKFLHLHLLELVNEHYHVKRPFNRKQAEIHMHRKACMLPETEAAEKRAEDVFKFAYPADLFKYYKSTEIVTNSKIRIPKYMKKLFFIGGASLFGIIYILVFSDNKIFNHVKGEDENKEFISNTTDSKVINPDQTTLKSDNRTAEEREAQKAMDLSVECRKAINLEKHECVKWFDDLSKNGSSVSSTGQVFQTVSYNPNKPYDFEYQPQVQPTDFPRMSGVIKLSSGKLVAIDQQGNYLTGISQQDCQKWLDGYRPFNYFSNNRSDMSSTEMQRSEISTQTNQPIRLYDLSED